MTDSRTVEQVSQDIDRQRVELAAALATVRHDLRDALVKQVPRIGLAAAVVLGGLAVRRLTRRKRREPTEWFRFGRFAVVEKP